jgi:hypothetical protein
VETDILASASLILVRVSSSKPASPSRRGYRNISHGTEVLSNWRTHPQLTKEFHEVLLQLRITYLPRPVRSSVNNLNAANLFEGQRTLIPLMAKVKHRWGVCGEGQKSTS